MKRYLSLLLVFSAGLLFHVTAFAQTVTLGKSTTLRAKTTNAESYEWTFPGGVVINGEVVQYTFNEAGPQDVRLKVTDFEGNTNETTKRILVANEGRPTAVIDTAVNGKRVTGSVVEAYLNDQITLSSASFAPEKQATDFTNTWSINGRNYAESALSMVFDKIGIYSVSLTVKDLSNGNQQDTASVQVKIVNQAPVITGIEISNITASGEQVQVVAQAEDPDGTISSYKFEALESGRSMMTQVVSTNSTVFDLSRFAGQHEYNFRVTASDDRFLSTEFTDTQTVMVDPVEANAAPVVKLQITPGNQGFTEEPFDFKAVATDAEGDALRYEWISSDGYKYSGSQFQKTYFTAGTYDMTVNVSDGLETTSETLTITIVDKPVETVINHVPEIEIYGVLPGKTAPMNELFRFYLKATDADQDRLTYEWDFGNGNKSFTQNAAILYSQPGDYTVEVTVSDGTETVSDSVNITVELGAKEIYLESAEDRLVDLQAEQQQLLALIEANGGDLTPAQQAQLAATNDNIEALIADARANGDFETLLKLEQMNAALNRAVGPVESVVADGMTLEELAVQLEEEQAAQIVELQAQAAVLEEVNNTQNKATAAEVEAEIEAAIEESALVFEEIEADRALIVKQKEDARIALEAAYESGKLENIALAQAEFDRVDEQLKSADEERALINEKIKQAQSKTKQQKIDAKRALEAAYASGDAENAALAQAEIERLDTLITDSEAQILLTTEKISQARLDLAKDKQQAKDDLEVAKAAGDTENIKLAEAELARVNGLIADAEAESILTFDKIEKNRAATRQQKEKAQADLAAAKATGNSENIALAEAEMARINLELEESDAKLIEIQNEIVLNRIGLADDKEQAKLDLEAAKTVGDTENEALAQAELDRITDMLDDSADKLLEIEATIKLSREELKQDKEQAKLDLEAAKAAGDAENEALARQQLDDISDRLDKSADDLETLQGAIAAAKEDIKNDKLAAIEALKTAKAAGDTENEALAQARIDELMARDLKSAETLNDIKDSILDNQATLKTDKAEAINYLNETFASGNTENIALAQAALTRVRTEINAAQDRTIEINENISASRAELKTDKDLIKKSLKEAQAAGDTENAHLAQVELDRVQALLTQAEADTLELNQTIADIRTDAKAELSALIAERQAYVAAGDAVNAAAAEAQIKATEALVADLDVATINQRQKLKVFRADLVAEQASLIAERKAYEATGDAENAARATAQQEIINNVISQANQATLELSARIENSRIVAEQDQIKLIAELQSYESVQDTENAARAQVRLEAVNLTIANANQASLQLQGDIDAMRSDLELEQAQLLEELKVAKAESNAENVLRMQTRLNEVEAQISATETQSKELQNSIERNRKALAKRKESLIIEMQAARVANDAARIEAIQKQLADTERLMASLNSMDPADYYAAQTSRFKTEEEATQLMIDELQSAQAKGLSPEAYLANLQAQVAVTDVNSDEFQSAALAIEQQDRIKRSNFLADQITNLETISQTPTELPALGVNRQSSESLSDRLDRLENQAQRASTEAAERQVAAAKIATISQQAKVVQLARMEAELAAEDDPARQKVMEARIEKLKQEIAELEKIKHPEKILSQAQVEAKIDELLAEVKTLSGTVATEQQAFIATRLAELQAEIDLASDPQVKANLESEKKVLEANIGQTEILTDYASRLKAQQQTLNQRSATDLNLTTKLLVETQLESIETKLNNLDKLAATQSELDGIDLNGGENPELKAKAFLSDEKQALELELRQIKVSLSRTQDPIDIKALKQREADIEAQLKTFPKADLSLDGVEDLRVTDVLGYLKHYRNVKAKNMTVGLNDELEQEVQTVDAQIALLNRLNSFGYTPQTRLSTLLVDLQRREADLLEVYRMATGTKAESLKNRLVVIGKAMEQIEGLEAYNISMEDSVFKANQKLEAAIEGARNLYLESENESQKLLARQTLELIAVSQRWLGKFYKADQRDITLAQLESELRASLTDESTPAEIEALNELQSVKANLNKAVAVQFETDFDNFKTNLQKQAKQVSDPDEKRAIDLRIKALQSDDLLEEVTLEKVAMFEELLADITIKVDTNLFLYADIPLSEYPEPLLFEWDLGDGEKRYGQNVNYEYFEPGFYRVVLTMYDGVTSEQDLFTIRVTE